MKYFPILLLFSSLSFGGAPEGTSTEKVQAKINKSWFPIIGYAPTYGILYGGGFFVSPKRENSYRLSFQGIGTFKSVFMGIGNFQIWRTNQNSFGLKVLTSNFFVRHYGDGIFTDAENYIQVEGSNYKTRIFTEYSLTSIYKTRLFLDSRIRNEKESSQRLYSNESTHGFGTSLIRDTRNHELNPTGGMYHSINAAVYPRVLSQHESARTFSLYEVDLRFFNPMGKSVLASRFNFGTSSGTPTYAYKYYFGGRERLRGYYQNRFRGKKFYSIQNEGRIPVWKSVSGVVFIDGGSITDEDFEGYRSSYGLGIRIGLPPNFENKFRIDYGMASDQRGIFVSFNQVY